MIKSTYRYLLNYPTNKFLRFIYASLILFLSFIIVSNKIKLSTDLFYLILTLIMWLFAGTAFLIAFIKVLNDNTKKQWVRSLGLICGIIILAACYVGPIILYLFAKDFI